MKSRGRASTDHPRNLLTSMMLVFPLLIVYQVGVLYTLPQMNGADFITSFVFHWAGLHGYLVFVAAVILGFIACAIWLRRRQHFDARVVVPLLLESSIWALTMGGLISLVMIRLLHIDPPRMAAAKAAGGPLTNLIMSFGAGVYEETVFRLGLLTGLVALFERLLGLRRLMAVLLGLLLSSAAFSAVHHLGPLGDPLAVWIFTFRLLAGVLFGLLFWFRGFAVAVYTHAIYDVIVLVFHR
jgi:membrane protease YdiL (CAAX protease family)